MKLSATMIAAITHIRIHGGVIVRVSGGFWTTPITHASADVVGPVIETETAGARPAREYLYERDGAPAWHIGVQTVRALEARGYLKRARRYAEEWRDDRRASPFCWSCGGVSIVERDAASWEHPPRVGAWMCDDCRVTGDAGDIGERGASEHALKDEERQR